MKKISFSSGTEPHDARLHRIVYYLVIFCMCGLVIEGAFFVPAIIVWYGWPNLTVQEICDEMHKVIYQDERRTCLFPYPLLESSEPRRYSAYTVDIIGTRSPTNAVPLYHRIGFRELIDIREKRLARSETISSKSDENN